MSKMGRKPIALPEGVTCTISSEKIIVKGKKGELSIPANAEVSCEVSNGQIIVSPNSNSVVAKKLWGTFRALLSNMVQGVSEGFTKKLEITGVGYRVNLKGRQLVMQLGFSHDVVLDIPEGLTVVCPDATHVDIYTLLKNVTLQ